MVRFEMEQALVFFNAWHGKWRRPDSLLPHHQLAIFQDENQKFDAALAFSSPQSDVNGVVVLHHVSDELPASLLAWLRLASCHAELEVRQTMR
jgi:hypothetical protein